MKRDHTRFIKKIFSVFLLIILGIFVFKTASMNRTAPWDITVAEERAVSLNRSANDVKAKLTEREKKIKTTALSETVEAKKAAELSETIKNSKVHIKRAFGKITIAQLDEAEYTADSTTTQYWKNDLLFFERAGEFALYGMNEERASRGLIVRRSDCLFLMDEYYFSPTLVYPRIFADDFDGDGEKEAVIILHRLTGTGFCVEELFLLDETEKEHISDWKTYQFNRRDYIEQAEEKLGIEVFNDKNQVHLFTSDKSQDVFVDLSDELIFADGEVIVLEDKMIIGDIVGFYVEEGILKVSFGIGLSSKRSAIPLYLWSLPDAEAEISYKDGEFKLGKLKFIYDAD